MKRSKKVALFSNLAIVCVLIGLGVAVFTADLSSVFISVGAPVSNGDRARGGVTLMFVVEPQPTLASSIGMSSSVEKNLNALLKFLEDHDNMPAAFFVGGQWAYKNQGLVRKMVNTEYLTVGNHGNTNTSFTKLGKKAQYKEIESCQTFVNMCLTSTEVAKEGGNVTADGEEMGRFDTIGSKDGYAMKYFMPPNGDFNKTTLRAAKKMRVTPVLPSVDTTRLTYGETRFSKAATAQPGDFVLIELNDSTTYNLSIILTDWAKRAEPLNVIKLEDNLAC